MTVEAYAATQGQKPKRKGTARDAIAQFAPGMQIPGVTD